MLHQLQHQVPALAAFVLVEELAKTMLGAIFVILYVVTNMFSIASAHQL
jgi:hypothetical protein